MKLMQKIYNEQGCKFWNKDRNKPWNYMTASHSSPWSRTWADAASEIRSWVFWSWFSHYWAQASHWNSSVLNVILFHLRVWLEDFQRTAELENSIIFSNMKLHYWGIRNDSSEDSFTVTHSIQNELKSIQSIAMWQALCKVLKIQR